MLILSSILVAFSHCFVFIYVINNYLPFLPLFMQQISSLGLSHHDYEFSAWSIWAFTKSCHLCWSVTKILATACHGWFAVLLPTLFPNCSSCVQLGKYGIMLVQDLIVNSLWLMTLINGGTVLSLTLGYFLWTQLLDSALRLLLNSLGTLASLRCLVIVFITLP